MRRWLPFGILLAVILAHPLMAEDEMKALIIDGQNNHKAWPTTTRMMKSYLEETGLFTVDVATTAPKGTDPNFHPDFSSYAVVISNYNGAPWPEKTKAAFVDYVRSGGGFVVIHAADNAFPNWPEYNEMIGLGGWGGRNEKSGPYVYYTDEGKVERDPSAGRGGSHGPRHAFLIRIRDRNHPITRGMPPAFMHAQDELYDRLRGPAANLHVLATAYSSKERRGTGRHEPMWMTVSYGKGRVFHSTLGHDEVAQSCVGFIVSLQRGAEWAATGNVTQPLPDDFPDADHVRTRKFTE